ncbi:MAG: amino acid permease [Saprospiraceae bacterium]|nr:amino acid permease [Saprospiraceae bacterium]MDW8484395.1 amino acid permease [Saprospiraceae bacterium]
MLRKALTLYGLTMIAVGSCIGSGIFVTPGQIAQAVPNAALVLLAWALGGVLALTGALTFSELGGMFPRSGGVYTYLREAYGDLPAFLYGWIILLVVNSGALAGLGAAFAEYMRTFFPTMSEAGKVGMAAATVLGLTALNILGVRISQALSNVLTGLKLLAIASIIAVGFLFGNAEQTGLHLSLREGVPDAWATALLTALIGVIFSVGGWHHASYVAGEALNAPRTVPRAMILGVFIVTATYLLVNIAYLLLLPLQDIARTPRVAGEALERVVPWGGRAVAAAIALSIFGTVSIYTMSAPRIYFAMASDGIFFQSLASVHARWRTPVVAMVIQAVWAVGVLLFFGGLFEHIIVFVTFADALFMGLAGAAVFVLRRKRPDAERPVRVWGYPVVPAIFVLISVAFAGNTLLERPEQALPGLGLLAIGVGIFWRFKAGAENNDSQDKSNSLKDITH